MKFCNFLLRVDGIREASLEDFKRVVEIGPKIYQPDNQKFLYKVENEIIDNRFYWMSCEHDDTSAFKDYVINQDTENMEPNPRTRNQIEPRQQFFACYDTYKHMLFVNDINKRSFLKKYLNDALQKEFSINNIYASVNDFCDQIKTIKGFKFLQVDNLFARSNDIFRQITNMFGLDAPSELQIKISYGNIPVHESRKLLDRFSKEKNDFENIIVIGCDDEGVEKTFDFSSIIKRIEIKINKDVSGQYDANEVKYLLLSEIR